MPNWAEQVTAIATAMLIADNSAEVYVLFRGLDYFEQLGALEKHSGFDFELIRSLVGARLIDRWDLWQPSIDAYVREMILNEFLHWRRRESRQIPPGASSDVDHRSAPDHALRYAERDALFAELGKLPARQRAVLALRYYEGLGDTEIADLIGCKPGTVRGYAARALAALRVEMNVRPDQSPAFIQEKI